MKFENVFRDQVVILSSYQKAITSYNSTRLSSIESQPKKVVVVVVVVVSVVVVVVVIIANIIVGYRNQALSP